MPDIQQLVDDEDLPEFSLDLATRNILGISPGSAVSVRPAVSSALARDFTAVSFILVAAFFSAPALQSMALAVISVLIYLGRTLSPAALNQVGYSSAQRRAQQRHPGAVPLDSTVGAGGAAVLGAASQSMPRRLWRDDVASDPAVFDDVVGRLLACRPPARPRRRPRHHHRTLMVPGLGTPENLDGTSSLENA